MYEFFAKNIYEKKVYIYEQIISVQIAVGFVHTDMIKKKQIKFVL